MSAHLSKILSITEGWAIDERYANKCLSRFLLEIELSEKGASRQVAASIIERRNENGDTFADLPNGKKIGIVSFSGAMQLEESLSTPSIKQVSAQIAKMDTDPSVSHILLRLNTGGGEVLAGQELKNAIADTGKPIMVLGDTLASAGYYSAIEADAIYLTGEMSEAGSIGVMVRLNMEYLKFLKESTKSVYATTSPDKNAEYEAILEGDYSKLVVKLDQTDEKFMNAVRNARNLTGTEEYKKETLAGGMFMASEAIERGLIDGMATQSEALEILAGMKGKKSKKIKNSKNMNFTDLTKKAFWAGVFGGKPEDTPEQVAQTMEDFATKFADIQTQMTAMGEKVGTLEAQVSALTIERETLSAQVAAFTVQVASKDALITDLSAQLTAQKAANLQMANEVNTYKLQGNAAAPGIVKMIDGDALDKAAQVLLEYKGKEI